MKKVIPSILIAAFLSTIFIPSAFAEDLNYSVSVEPALNITTSAFDGNSSMYDASYSFLYSRVHNPNGRTIRATGNTISCILK